MASTRLAHWVRAATDVISWAADAERKIRPVAPDVVSELARKRLDGLYYLAVDPGNPTQRLYDRIWQEQRRALVELLSRLEDSGVSAWVFKGAEVAERYLASRPISVHVDVDILVPPDQLVATMSVLYQHGFKPCYFDPEQGQLVDQELRDVATIELQHFQLPAFARLIELKLEQPLLEQAASRNRKPLWVVNQSAKLLLEVDVHHALAADLEAQPFLEHRVSSAFGRGWAPTAAAHLWCILVRYYNEVALYDRRTLRDLAYGAAIIGRGKVDWDDFVSLTEKYDVRPSAFYPLSFLSQLAPGCVPTEVLETLKPLRGSRARDFGWQLGKLFDFVEPVPEFTPEPSAEGDPPSLAPSPGGS